MQFKETGAHGTLLQFGVLKVLSKASQRGKPHASQCLNSN